MMDGWKSKRGRSAIWNIVDGGVLDIVKFLKLNCIKEFFR